MVQSALVKSAVEAEDVAESIIGASPKTRRHGRAGLNYWNFLRASGRDSLATDYVEFAVEAATYKGREWLVGSRIPVGGEMKPTSTLDPGCASSGWRGGDGGGERSGDRRGGGGVSPKDCG